MQMDGFLTLKGGNVELVGAPETIFVLPIGHVVSSKGEFDVDDESYKAMKAQIAKRGVELCCVHYHSFPYTSERAREKVLELARLLSEYCGKMRVHVVPFTEIQMQIHAKCPENYTTLIMRRYMMRIAEIIARKDGAQALITGESIGQVASQTMEALGCTDAVVNMPVFRPAIGMDKSEIIERAQKIGTFETSSLPYEDCCTVFTPKHPATHPRIELIQKAEDALDSEALIAAAIEGTEVIEVG